MLKDFLHSRFNKLVVVVVAIALAGWIGWSIYYANFVFHITSTMPKTSSVAAISPYFKVNFNRVLASEGLDVSITPNVARGVSVTNKSVIINLNGLTVGTSYKVLIKTVHDTKNETIQNKEFVFIARDISYKSLSKDQQAAILARQDYTPSVNKDPALGHLPHSTLTYTLSGVISAGGDSNASGLSLKADLLLTGADMRSNPDAAIAQYKQQVVDYIKSLGLDPNNYVISYNVVEPAF